MEYQIQILNIMVAMLLGALIGYERERLHKPAGLRTHMMVSVSSALLVIVAIEQFPSEVARVVAGMITGIGFLGAGSIMSSNKNVHGLTTAASVWMICIIGITAGMGMYQLSVMVTVLTFLILRFGVIERELEHAKR